MEIDNSGDGNCMYYAYGISLMYYLRAKADASVTEAIFNRLSLTDDEKLNLQNLLNKDKTLEFSKNEIKSTIEPILGRATRTYAAKLTVEDFKENPEATSLYTAAAYGIAYYLKQALHIESELKDKNFLDAEIYKVQDIKKNMQAHFSPEHIQRIENERNTGKSLDDITRDETIDFFSKQKWEQLKAYERHLQTNYIWGTEELMMCLHRGIQGEEVMRDEESQRVDVVCMHPIVLHIYRNGKLAVPAADKPDMKINHVHGNHWTSLIPEEIFTPKVTPKSTGVNQSQINRHELDWSFLLSCFAGIAAVGGAALLVTGLLLPVMWLSLAGAGLVTVSAIGYFAANTPPTNTPITPSTDSPLKPKN